MKTSAKEIRIRANGLQFGQTLFLTTSKQCAIAEDQLRRTLDVGASIRVSAKKGDTIGYLVVRTN